MLVSITAGALVGRFGRQVQRIAIAMVRDGLVHDVASDAHDAGPRRPPGLTAEMQEAGLETELPRLCRIGPEAILTGRPVPPPLSTAGPARGGLLSRLLRRA
jgi:protein-tyrosine phosphatase